MYLHIHLSITYLFFICLLFTYLFTYSRIHSLYLFIYLLIYLLAEGNILQPYMKYTSAHS